MGRLVIKSSGIVTYILYTSSEERLLLSTSAHIRAHSDKASTEDLARQRDWLSLRSLSMSIDHSNTRPVAPGAQIDV